MLRQHQRPRLRQLDPYLQIRRQLRVNRQDRETGRLVGEDLQPLLDLLAGHLNVLLACNEMNNSDLYEHDSSLQAKLYC